MRVIRTIKKTTTSIPTLEGAGVRLRRAFGFHGPEETDPFLLLDDFRSNDPADYIRGFPWHPHRGIDTITYLLQGEVEHGDSLGNRGTIGSGDVQWMTAGSGIIHQEMPKGDGKGMMHGFQLWLNLPARDKMCRPRYRDIKAAEIPQLHLEPGVVVKAICGTIGDISGPVTGISMDPEYFDVTLAPGKTFQFATRLGYTVIAYAIGGSGRFAPQATSAGNTSLILFNDGEAIEVSAEDHGLRFLLLSAKPLKEPIAWRGPIVMNTEEELITAFDEYHRGTFLKAELSS